MAPPAEPLPLRPDLIPPGSPSSGGGLARLRWPSWRPWTWSPVAVGVILVAVGLLVSIGLPVWHVAQAVRRLTAVQASLGTTSQPSPLPLDQLPRIRGDLDLSAAELRDARAGLAPFDPFLGLLGRAPPARVVASVPDLLDLTVNLAGAASDLADGLDNPQLGPPNRARDLVAGLAARQDRFQRAALELRAAGQARSRLDRALYSGWLAPVGRRLDEVDRLLPPLQAGATALAILPRALGARQPMTYLLAGQNEDERRATGGFVGSLGIVRVDKGQVTHIDVRNSYDFSPTTRDPLPPPAPLATLMGFGGWYIRDANWFPDFPTSAAWIEWFWNYYYGEQPDGVIAFDQEAFQQLLQVTGPIYVPNLKESITAQNYRDRMLYWLYGAGSPTGERQAVRGAKTTYVSQVGMAIFKQLVEFPPSEILKQAPLIERLLVEKHIQISLRDPTVAQLLADQGWDGHLDRSASDFVLASDTTVTYTKVASYVAESIDVGIALGRDGASRHAVSVVYTNNYDRAVAHGTYPLEYLGEFWNHDLRRIEFHEGIYATYLRLFVPAAAQLTAVDGADGFVSTDQQSGRRVFTAYVELPAGQEKTVRFSYVLPPVGPLADQPYHLLVQKQPGTLAMPLTVRVIGPPGYAIRGAANPSATASWTTDLRQDRRYDVQLVAASPGAVP